MSETLRIAIRKFGPFEDAMRRQFADFKTVTGSPYELELVSLDLNPLVDTLFTQGGLREGFWDVAFIVTDWLAEAIADCCLLDLAPRLVADPIPDYPVGWAPALTRMQRDGDAVYGIPYHDGPECLIFRKDWSANPVERRSFEAAYGYPLDTPRTWEEFEQIARFFTRPDEGRYGTILAAYPDGHNTVYDFCLQLWSRGGELHDADGRPTLDNPAAHAALDFYRRVVADRTLTPPDLELIDSVKSGELFAEGSIAMMVNWFGFAAYCEQPDSPVKGKVAIAPIPAGPGGASASLNVYWLLGIAAGSKHQDAAYAFVKHCATPAMDKVTALAGGIGCRLSTWRDPEVNAAIPFYRDLESLHQHTRELPRSKALPRLIHIIDNAIQRAISTSDPTAEILRAAQAEASAFRLD